MPVCSKQRLGRSPSCNVTESNKLQCNSEELYVDCKYPNAARLKVNLGTIVEFPQGFYKYLIGVTIHGSST